MRRMLASAIALIVVCFCVGVARAQAVADDVRAFTIANGGFSLEAPAELEARRRLRFTEVERLGDDLRLMARF
jgi:hypothetical protein